MNHEAVVEAEENLVELKSKDEIRQDIVNRMFWLLEQRKTLTIEYKEKVRKIDDEYSELSYQLNTGNY